MKYPILYAQNATDFFSLGLGPLKNTLSAKVIEERNGSFYLEAEILVDSPIFPLVLNDCLIKADASHLLKDQRFRIKRIVPKHDGTAEIYAEHISYLAEELTLKPEVSINGSASGALSAWKGAIVEANPFVVDSDISTTNSTKWRIDKVANPRQALGGVGGSILDVWGGEYRFDNYHISLLKKRGTTANTVLAYGRNITDFEQENNIANTYTSIVPYAIYTDDNENEITVTVDGYTVHSQYAGNYPNTRSLPVNFSDEFDYNEVPTKAKLTQLAEQYITANDVGVPKTSIKVSFMDLSKSPDYAEYQHLEELNLCDDVRVDYPKLGVNTTAKVIRTVWNVLTESYDEIEIGEKRMTLSSKINEQTKQIKETNKQTNYALISADGKNIIFYGLYGQDGLGEPTATKVGDSWYKPDGEFTELRIWNGTIWEFIMSTKENHEIRETIEAIEEEIVVMTVNINTAVDNANQAVIDAGFATDTANTATTLATNANKSAQDAVSQSSQAYSLAVQSATDASAALSNAQTAMSNAKNALNKSIKTNAITYAVSTSQTTVPTSGWQATVPTASSTQYVWTRTSVTLQDDSVIYIYNVGGRGAQGVKGDTGAGGANAPKITAVKPQFYLSTSNASQAGGNWSDTIPTWVDGRHYWVRYVTTYDNSTTSTSTPTLDTGLNTALVTSLQAKSATETLSTTVSQHATQIEARALKTTVDTLTGRVDTAEGSITANATAITQRATKTEVNTLSGRVSTAEGQISTQARQIAQRLTASEVNSLVDGKGYATTASVNSQVSRIDGDINSWSSQLQTVQATVDGIEIGGRNLLIRTTETNNTLISLEGTVSTILNHATSDFVQISPNKEYFFTKKNSELVISDNSNGVTGFWRFAWYDENKTYINRKPNTTNSFLWRAPNNAHFLRVSYPVDSYPKLERGNKATDWSPAPEDLATVTQLTTNVNQINQTIKGTNNSIQLLTQTVQNQGGSISSISSSLSVETGRINALNTKTNGHETKIGNLETSYSGLRSTVTEVQNSVADITSIFKDSKFELSSSVGILGGSGWLTNNNTGPGRIWTNNTGQRNRFYFDNASTVKSEVGRYYDIRFKANTGLVPWELEVGTNGGKNLKFTIDNTARWYTGTIHTTNSPALSFWVENTMGIRVHELYVYESTASTSTQAFSDFQQTVQGFQTTVNSRLDNKAEQSQVTQLANQITSVVSDLSSIGTDNIFPFGNAASMNNAQANANWNGGAVQTTYHDFYMNRTSPIWIIQNATTNEMIRRTRYIPIQSNSTYTVKFWGFNNSSLSSFDLYVMWSTTTGNGTNAAYDGFVAKTSERLSNSRLESFEMTFTTGSNWKEIYIRIDNNGRLVGGSSSTGDLYFTDFMLVQGRVAPSSYSLPTSHFSSQITQLATDINLRVTKNDVINQINVSTEGILIAGNKVRITGQTSIDSGVIKTAMIGDAQISGAKIDNATISSAKIISLDAGKLTAGMINTSNITIGTATSGKRVNITGAGLIAHDSSGRLRVKLGVQDLAGDGQSDPSTLVFYTGNGTKSASIGTNTNDTFVIGTEQSGVYTLIRTPTQLTLESSSVRVNSPNVASNNFWNFANLNINGTQHPNLSANIAGTGTIGTSTDFRLRKIFTVEADTQYLSVGVGDTTVAADFNTGADSNGGRIWSMATYNRTYSGSANMFITNAGTFGRVTSARKYKMDIQVADHAVNNAKKILQINPVSWIDKSAFLNGKSKHRYHGFIADDFHDLGLNEVVIYGSDGQVESLAYDRISMYHNVILKEHEHAISKLNADYASADFRIRVLEDKVNKLEEALRSA